MRLGAPRAVASTLGKANPSHVTLTAPYRWRGIKGWEPGASHLVETAPRRPGPAADYRNSAESKAARLATFTEARESGATIAEAGRITGIAIKTARAYEVQRKALLVAAEPAALIPGEGSPS